MPEDGKTGASTIILYGPDSGRKLQFSLGVPTLLIFH